MVAASMGSFLNIEQSLERFMLVAAIGVLLLVVYQVIVVISSILATRANRDENGAAPGIGQPSERIG